ncbi:MAG: hypothetical protein GC162_17425 [Planctomycetes bacterium]|nr:hypothetical protein [Planctomycetota bacterium]
MKQVVRTALVLTVVLLMGIAHAEDKPKEGAGGEAPPPAAGQFKPIRVEEACRELVNECRKKLRELKVFPRKTSNYAIETNTMIEGDQVIKAMGRRWDRMGPIDGYVKWQLLSYQPNISQADKRDLGQIVSNLPELLPRPPFTPQQAKVFAAAEKTAMEQYKDKIRELISAYELSVNEVASLNQPAIEFRDAVMAEIPQEGGLRIQARLMDAEARFMAGDMRYKAAMKSLVTDVRLNKDSKEVMTPALRTRLLAEIERLKKLNNPMPEDITLANVGTVKVTAIGRIFEHKQDEELIGYVSGQEPAKK